MNKYISDENEQKINDLLNDKNAEFIMKTMISKYSANSLENAQNLSLYINDIVSNIIKITSKNIQDLNQAAWMLMFQREMDIKDIHTYFATIVPVCKTLFPNGEPINGNLSQKEYFNKFLALFANKKAFSWNKESDVEWAMQYDYYDYLQMIWDNYISDKGDL